MRNIKNGSGTIYSEKMNWKCASYLEMALRCQGYSVEMAQDGEELLELPPEQCRNHLSECTGLGSCRARMVSKP